jgi:hypothetical protein
MKYLLIERVHENRNEYFITDMQKSYYAGTDTEAARTVVASLNLDNGRPNIEQREDGLYICWNLHEKHEGCQYEKAIDYTRYQINFDPKQPFYPGYRDPTKLLQLNIKSTNKSSREEVYSAINTERDYQDKLGADRTDGRQHQLAGFVTMMNHYMQKLNETWTLNAGDEEALKVVRKIAGIAVHAMEKHGAIPRK